MPAAALAATGGGGLRTAFLERRWRTIKWEHICLNPAADGHHLHHQVQAYFTYYNHRRPHQSLSSQTPDRVFAKYFFIQA
jgi:putative transposase